MFAHFDVCILPYILDGTPWHQAPQAQGIPRHRKTVVATPLPEAERLGRVLILAESGRFAEAVTQVLRSPGIAPPGLAAFLQGESWDARRTGFSRTSWRDYERNRSHPRPSITTMFPNPRMPVHASSSSSASTAGQARGPPGDLPHPWVPGGRIVPAV